MVKPLLRALALGVGPFVIAGGMGMLAKDQSDQPLQRLASLPPISAAPCTQPPVFKPINQAGREDVQKRGEGFHFGSESMLGAMLCSAGTLKITAAGQVAGGAAPELTVTFNDNILSVSQFSKERTIKLQISEAGQVFLGFFNDYYETDSRVIFLKSIKLSGEGCQDLLNPQFERGKGINMNPIAHTASLAIDLPLTFVPCRAGKLKFLLKGRKGDNALPVLQISQEDQLLYQKRTNAEWEIEEIFVRSKPLKLRILNPYWKTLGDRNLEIIRMEFIPYSK